LRPAKVVTLREIHPYLDQLIHFVLTVNIFGYRFHTQNITDLVDRLDQGIVHLIIALVTPAKRGKGNKRTVTDETQDQTPVERRASMTWAQRLKRVFNIGRSCASLRPRH